MTKKKHHKVQHKYIDEYFVKERSRRIMAAGYTQPKWLFFCEELLKRGYTLRLYEARETDSKYITVCKMGREYKIRFSNHRPSYHKEVYGDCNFFVGVTNLGTTNTMDALAAVEDFFSTILKRRA